MSTHPANSPIRHASATPLARDGPVMRMLGAIALIGVAFITVTCVLVQFLRTDLNWIALVLEWLWRAAWWLLRGSAR